MEENEENGGKIMRRKMAVEREADIPPNGGRRTESAHETDAQQQEALLEEARNPSEEQAVVVVPPPGGSTSFATDDESPPLTADVCSLIQAHLVVEPGRRRRDDDGQHQQPEDDDSVQHHGTIQNNNCSSSSSRTVGSGSEDDTTASRTDEEMGSRRRPVVVVDATPWNEFVLLPSSRLTKRLGVGVVVTLLLVTGLLALLGRSFRDGGVRATTTTMPPTDVVVATPEQEQDHQSEGDDDLILSSSSSLAPTWSPALPDAVRADPERFEQFLTQFQNLLPDGTRSALADPSSPQSFAFEYATLVLSNFPELPPDTATWLNLFAIKVFHTTTNGDQWYGSCRIPPVTTRSMNICRIRVAQCRNNTNNDATREHPQEQIFVALEAPGQGVQGYLAPEMGLMQDLVTLQLPHNNLTRTLPRELGLLRKLEHLDLSFNRFEGEIPVELFSPHNSLVTIRLNNNAFRGRLLLLQGLQQQHNDKLEILELHSNDLEGPIPESWSTLTKLRNVTLHDNPKLSGSIPEGWCDRIRAGQLRVSVDCNRVSCGAGSGSSGSNTPCKCHCVNTTTNPPQ